MGFSEAKFGPRSSMIPPSLGNMWDIGYIYKGIGQNLGWSPEKSGGWMTNFYVYLGALHVVSGFTIEKCPSVRPCSPWYALFATKNVTLARDTKFSEENYVYEGPLNWIWYTAESVVIVECIFG